MSQSNASPPSDILHAPVAESAAARQEYLDACAAVQVTPLAGAARLLTTMDPPCSVHEPNDSLQGAKAMQTFNVSNNAAGRLHDVIDGSEWSQPPVKEFVC